MLPSVWWAASARMRATSSRIGSEIEWVMCPITAKVIRPAASMAITISTQAWRKIWSARLLASLALLTVRSVSTPRASLDVS